MKDSAVVEGERGRIGYFKTNANAKYKCKV